MESVTPAGENLDLQLRKIEIEEKKVEIELDKIKIERLRAWTGSASTFGSLLVVAATVALGIWSQYEQAKLQHEIQERQAKAQFELKAAEIVMSTDNPDTTLNKAKALQSLFPHYLPTTFAESFVPTSFARPEDVAVVPVPAGTNSTNFRKATVNNKPAPAGTEQVFAFSTGKPKIVYKRQIPRVQDVSSDQALDVENVDPAVKQKRYTGRPTPKPTAVPASPTPTP